MGLLDTKISAARTPWALAVALATSALPARRELPLAFDPGGAVAEPSTPIMQDAPAWVLLHVEGQARGFKNALAFRRWLRRHQVPVRRDGHRLWVRRVDVDRAIEGLESASSDASSAPSRAAVAEAVAVVTRRH